VAHPAKSVFLLHQKKIQMKTFKLLPILLLVALMANPAIAQKKQQKKVKKCFENYKSAILNDRGEEAVNYVDSRTIAYYSEMIEKTKSADSAEVDALGIMDKLMVFSMRHRATKEQILSFDGKSALVYAIEEGMVGKESVATASLGVIDVDGNFAKGQFVNDGQKTPIYYHFYKEDGDWKIDLTSIFDIAAMAFRNMQKESGMTENEFLFTILEMITGKKPGPEIWETLI
jgi:hypothetical protein